VDADLVTAIRYVNVAVFGGVTLAALRLHRSLRTGRSRWLVATFATVAVVTLTSVLLPSDPTMRSGLQHFVGDVVIAILLLFPYCLYRFTSAFDAGSRWVLHIIHATIALLVLSTFVLPPQAPAPAPTTPEYSAFVAAVLTYWTVLSLWVVVRLWRGGRGQPSVARRRMRLLAAATLLFNIGLLIAGARNEPGSALALTTTALVWVSAGVFYLGFAPPNALRHAWRQDDERRLRHAEADLMSATTPEEVAETILPRVADLLGGHGAALIDPEGAPLAVHGFSPEQVSDVAAEQRTEHGETIERDRLVLHLRSGGSLVVQASAYAPFFGDEELDLLRSLATFVDLALSRIGLYEQERRTARELQRTNDELVALV
jgi:hypothetical protein